MKNSNNTNTVYQCEEWFFLSLQEITGSLQVTRETIFEILDEGIITAQKDEHEEWIFDHEAFRRIHTIIKLKRDLGVNLAGAALAIELLSEIDELRAQLGVK